MPRHCWCDCRALDDLFAEATRWPLRETGGALLGWGDKEAVVIARVLGPGPKAKHGWSSFEPDGQWQNEEGQRIYRESGRAIAYIGDWHSHPRGSTRPSRTDIETAEMLATDPDFRAPRALSAIAGRRFRWKLAIYEWSGSELVELDVEPCQLEL